jgi:hypothetical protein
MRVRPTLLLLTSANTTLSQKGRGQCSRPGYTVARRSVRGIVLDRAIDGPIALLGHSLGSESVHQCSLLMNDQLIRNLASQLNCALSTHFFTIDLMIVLSRRMGTFNDDFHNYSVTAKRFVLISRSHVGDTHILDRAGITIASIAEGQVDAPKAADSHLDGFIDRW